MLRDRLLLGPLMILALLGGGWLDQAIAGEPMPLGLGAVWPPGVVVLALALALAILGGRELARIIRDKGLRASTGATCLFAALGVVLSAALPGMGSLNTADAAGAGAGAGAGVVGGAAVSAGGALVMLGAMLYYSKKHRTDGLVGAVGGALLSYVYLGLLMGSLVLLRREHSVWVLVWVLLIVKSSDIGAFFTGRAVGRHKLIPWLSPGKTWEGLVGGVVLAAGIGALGAGWMAGRGAGFGALLGLVLAITGQVGDLMASGLKRDAGRKDMGRSVPGFGGVLDVLDSILLSMPVAFWLLKL